MTELPSYREGATTIETFMTEGEVVRRVDDAVTAFSVSTGKEHWSKQVPDRVDVSLDGSTLTLTKVYNPIWHRLALHSGESDEDDRVYPGDGDIPNDQIEVWSTKTGEKNLGAAAANILK